MLNKQNIIVSGLASIMLTCSFNCIAIAGLGNINMKKVNNNSNISINKPSHSVDSVAKGIIIRNHTVVLKNIDALKGHLNSVISSKNFTPSELKDNPKIAKKLQMINELSKALDNKTSELDISRSFGPYKVRLARLYKDHNHKLVKADAAIEKQNREHQEKAEQHKLEQDKRMQDLDTQIGELSGKLKNMDNKIKDTELNLDADVSQFFTTSVQPRLVTTVNFDKLTVRSLASTISFR